MHAAFYVFVMLWRRAQAVPPQQMKKYHNVCYNKSLHPGNEPSTSFLLKEIWLHEYILPPRAAGLDFQIVAHVSSTGWCFHCCCCDHHIADWLVLFHQWRIIVGHCSFFPSVFCVGEQGELHTGQWVTQSAYLDTVCTLLSRIIRHNSERDASNQQ